jgi:hypothetical protein
MPLHSLPEEQLRTICRQRIEACELWLRRLLHDKLVERFGAGYAEAEWNAGQKVLSAPIRRRIADRGEDAPRPMDALYLTDLCNLICRQDLYDAFFRPVFESAMRSPDQIRWVLDRLTEIRNALSHARVISVREAEQAICYSGDIVDPIKYFYREAKMSEAFPAPSFTRFIDSLGNTRHLSKPVENLSFRDTPLYEGDKLRMEVEVDASFPPGSYDVTWEVLSNAPRKLSGTAIEIEFGPGDIQTSLVIVCNVISKAAWHRFPNSDGQLNLGYEVRPRL